MSCLFIFFISFLPIKAQIIDISSSEFIDVDPMCITNPIHSDCFITLPAIEYDQTYTFVMPIMPGLDRAQTSFSTSNPDFQCSETNASSSLTITPNGEITAYLGELCNYGIYSPLEIKFNVTVVYPDSVPENYKVRIPIERQPLKVALVLDVSENMLDTIKGEDISKFDALRYAVNTVIRQLQYMQQEGDSISLSYFNTNVVQPSTSNFPKDFIPISSETDETINSDLDLLTPSGNTALGKGLLDARNKLLSDNSPGSKKMVFLISDGQQDYGNMLKLDGMSFNNSSDSLNNYALTPLDSISYFSISTTQNADVLPIMSTIADKNQAASYNINQVTGFNYLASILRYTVFHKVFMGKHPEEVATRITGIQPFDDSLNIEFNQNLSIRFNETVNINTGNIYIKRLADDSVFKQIDITSGQITGNNTDSITINPGIDFESDTEYYVLIDVNAVKGADGNNFAGIVSDYYWNFKTKDATPPSLFISTPDSITNNSPFEVNFVFSEKVVNFELADITVINGAVSSLNSSDSINYNASVTASAEGDVTISVEADVAEDLTGNKNLASKQLIVKYQTATGILKIPENELKVYSTDGNVIIEFVKNSYLKEGYSVAEVYSINGSLLAKQNLNKSFNSIVLKKPTSLCVVKVVVGNSLYIKEILLHK